jgi:hypothetical protein
MVAGGRLALTLLRPTGFEGQGLERHELIGTLAQRAKGGADVYDVDPAVGVVAQLVEQRTLNPKRVGSSPTGPTKKINYLRDNPSRGNGPIQRQVGAGVGGNLRSRSPLFHGQSAVLRRTSPRYP